MSLADAPLIPAGPVADDAPASRSLLAATADRRSRSWRRRTALVALYRDALAGADLTPPLILKVEAAAELRVISEEARSRYLAGEPVTLDDLVRVENQAARAEKALGLDRVRPKAAPSLDQYLATTAAA